VVEFVSKLEEVMPAEELLLEYPDVPEINHEWVLVCRRPFEVDSNS